jgi:ATP/maltotriose-dependent transcriptional regulator MalT
MTGAVPRSLPRLPKQVVPLTRPWKLLDQSAAITVVRGIQGYGKTTLVAAWLRDQPEWIDSAWVSVVPGAGTERAFRDRLVAALDRTGLTAAWSARDSQAGTAAPDQSLGPDALGLLDRVAAAIPQGRRLILVIDNAHSLRDPALLARLIEIVAGNERLQLILCSRGAHPIETLAACRVETIVLPARELLFNVAEIDEFARRLGAKLSIEQAQQLHEAFGGWPAAVALVLEETPAPRGPLPLSKAEQYLSETVLAGIGDEQTAAQVMRFSVAERLTQRLIRDVAHDDQPDALVRLLESTGITERQYDGEDVVLVYPSFVRSILRAAFTAQDPQGARTMHRRLSLWFADRPGPGHPLLALRHAVAGHDWEQLERIWSEHSMQLGLESPAPLAEALSEVPDDVLDTHPGMRVGLALARAAASEVDSDLDGRIATISAYLQASRRAAARGLAGMPLHDLLYVGTGHLIGLRMDGQPADSDQIADEIEHHTARLVAAGESPGDRLGWFYLQRGLTHTLSLRHREAAQCYLTAWQCRSDAALVGANAAANLALTHALAGAPRIADLWLARYREIDMSRTWGRHLASIGAHLAAAILALDQLDEPTCRRELDRAGEPSAPVDLWPYIAYLNANYGLHYSDPVATLDALDASCTAHGPELAVGGAADLLLARARADLLLAAGQGERARDLLTRDDIDRHATLAVAAARLNLVADQPGTARRMAASLLWHNTTDSRARLELLLIKAAAAHRMNDVTGSGEAARRALAMYRHTGLLRAFVTLPPGLLTELLGTAGDSLTDSELALLAHSRTPFPADVQFIKLTRREQILCEVLARTVSRREMADELYVSVNTIRKQLATLYRKLDVRSRDQALARLAHVGLTPKSA